MSSDSEQKLMNDLECFSLVFDRLFVNVNFAPSAVAYLLATNPREGVIRALIASTWNAAVAAPTNVERILSDVKAILDDERVHSLSVPWGNSPPEGPAVIFWEHLSQTVEDNIHIYQPDIAAIVPNNKALVSALLQAVGNKMGFGSLFHIRTVRRGLGIDQAQAGAEELAAVLALIVFAIVGAKRTVASYHSLWQQYDFEAGWKRLREDQVVGYAPAVSLLERTIVEVEMDSDEQRTSAEVWRELFPS